MFRAFFAFVFLVLFIQAVISLAAANVDNDKEASVTVTVGKLPFNITSPAATLKGPVGHANQVSAVSVNLRKKEEIEVDLEGVKVISNRYDDLFYVCIRYCMSTRLLNRCDTIRCRRSSSGAVDHQLS